MSQPTSRYIYSSNSNIEQSLVKMKHNGHVYEMFGNSKHYSVQPPLLYKPAEMTNKPLTAKYFIYDVVVWPLFYSFLALPLRFGKQ